MSNLVFFSSVSENTKRFVDCLEVPADRIPLRRSEGPGRVEEPYVLITPTYGGGRWNSAVPRQVVNFLNDPHNRSLIRGVIASGNTNFGEAYCLAGRVIATKCRVPQLYRFELIGTDHDVRAVSQRLEMFWQTQHQVA